MNKTIFSFYIYFLFVVFKFFHSFIFGLFIGKIIQNLLKIFDFKNKIDNYQKTEKMLVLLFAPNLADNDEIANL